MPKTLCTFAILMKNPAMLAFDNPLYTKPGADHEARRRRLQNHVAEQPDA